MFGYQLVPSAFGVILQLVKFFFPQYFYKLVKMIHGLKTSQTEHGDADPYCTSEKMRGKVSLIEIIEMMLAYKN